MGGCLGRLGVTRTYLTVSSRGDPCTIPQQQQHHWGNMGNAHSQVSPELLHQSLVDPLATFIGPPGSLTLLKFGNHCPSIKALSGGVSPC